MTEVAYKYEHQVTFAETNLVGNVYFAHYASWQGKCREQFLIERAPEVLEQLLSGELALVTVNLELNFIAECFAGDVIEIHMRRGGAGSGFRITMVFDYLRDGVTVATGKQTVAAMSKDAANGYQVCPLPEQMMHALAGFEPASVAS